jgi:iron complex outermembrane receptor protein
MSLRKSLLSNLSLGLLFGVAALWAAPAHPEAGRSGQEAQEKPPSEKAQAKPAEGPSQEEAKEKDAGQGVLEEIMVTARRVEERLQDTPISVAAFTADDLDQHQAFTTDLLDQLTPNLQFTSNSVLSGNNSASTIVIRGIGQIDPTSSVDPGVGLYIDEVYFGQSIGGSMEFRDIKSVQVLRGPQGTLFGRNSVGGSILLTTNEPGDEFGGSFRAGYGSDNLVDGFLALDVPVSDRFKSRFTAGVRKRDGYVLRVQTGEDLGDSDTFTGTAKFLWTPTSTFDARLVFDYTRNDENGVPFVFAAITEAATFPRVASADAGCPGFIFPISGPVPPIPDDRCANDLQAKGPFSNNGTYPLESKLDNWGTSLRLTLRPNDRITLKSISSYRSLDWTGIRDADNTPLTILHTDYDSDGEQWSQELQLQYSSAKLKGSVGLYYLNEDTTDIVYVQLNDPAPGIQEDSDNNITQNSSWAVFSQWTYDFAPKLSLTLGGRYTEDTKGSTPDQFNYANPSNKYLPVQLYEATFDAFTFSGTVSSRWNEKVMTYLSYAEGFKGGGWNSHFNTCQVLDPCANSLSGPPLANAIAAAAVFPRVHQFGPEEAQTIELGLKADLADGRLRLNGAAFTTDYTDLQFTYRSGVAPYLANAGKAGIDGFELEATWAPTSRWLINAGFGYLDSSVDELEEIAGTAIGVAVGNVLPFAPERQANLGISYRAPVGGRYTLAPRVNLYHQSETFFDANNTVEIAQTEPYTVLNASLEFAPTNGKWRLSAGVSNLTDELYATGGNSSLTTGAGYAEIAYARPREFFVSLSVGF